MKTLKILILFLLSLWSILAQGVENIVEFGPYIGQGTISTAAEVRHASGLRTSYSYGFNLFSQLTIGPQLVFANHFFNVKAEQEQNKYIATYDNRIFALGIRASVKKQKNDPLSIETFLSVVGGMGFSKLSVDESDDKMFKHSQYQNIRGQYFSSEVGVLFPVKESLALSLALISDLYKVNQKNARGTFTGNTASERGRFPLQGEIPKDQSTLEDTVYLKSTSAALGMIVMF